MERRKREKTTPSVFRAQTPPPPGPPRWLTGLWTLPFCSGPKLLYKAFLDLEHKEWRILFLYLLNSACAHMCARARVYVHTWVHAEDIHWLPLNIGWILSKAAGGLLKCLTWEQSSHGASSRHLPGSQEAMPVTVIWQLCGIEAKYNQDEDESSVAILVNFVLTKAVELSLYSATRLPRS